MIKPLFEQFCSRTLALAEQIHGEENLLRLEVSRIPIFSQEGKITDSLYQASIRTQDCSCCPDYAVAWGTGASEDLACEGLTNTRLQRIQDMRLNLVG